MLLKTMGGLVEEAGVSAAVDGDEDALPLGSTGEAHVVSRPALQEAVLVVIGARAFGLKRLAALETVDIEVPHIGADALEVLDEFVIGGHGSPFLWGWGMYNSFILLRLLYHSKIYFVFFVIIFKFF